MITDDHLIDVGITLGGVILCLGTMWAVMVVLNLVDRE